MTPEGIWLVFIFALGACVGSFLNVVIYRLPRDKSLIAPPSSCPKCGHSIAFYDNIPLLSWLFLQGKCRHCKARISVRYFIIELITALLFGGLYVAYFVFPIRQLGLEGKGALQQFLSGGWIVFIAQAFLLAGLLAASAIDLELWIIPLSLCWACTVIGVISSGASGYVIGAEIVQGNRLFPMASASVGMIATGGVLGLIVSMILLSLGWIKHSYDWEEDPIVEEEKDTESMYDPEEEPDCNHRAESLKEIIFLGPVFLGGLLAWLLYQNITSLRENWINFSQIPLISGLLGSAWGYFVGCGMVWMTRIFGTLAFGKEAMGLGDVHLMGAAGAVLGPFLVVLAFFVAPFFGLGWAGFQMLSRKTRQIPYGPFLSLGIVTVMILHDRLWVYFSSLYIK
ncbi:MAG: prepilin peptidase [Sedimentisphaerales bacterium]|nr:prepilin peptidase [Sedimentisphaerales bacterium]